MNDIIDVTAAVVVRDSRVLLTRRSPGERLAGWWEFPGGKTRPGESLQSCLERGLREELDRYRLLPADLMIVPHVGRLVARLG